MKRWAFYLLLGMLPVLGGCGREQVPDNMILTHKMVQAAQGKAPQEVKPVPVELSVLSKGMEKDSHGNIIYPYFEMKYDIAKDEKTFPYDHPDIVVGDAHYMTQINDWYMHFNNYYDKTVVIEGYFLTINGHYFIGRNGPTCPTAQAGMWILNLIPGRISQAIFMEIHGSGSMGSSVRERDIFPRTSLRPSIIWKRSRWKRSLITGKEPLLIEKSTALCTGIAIGTCKKSCCLTGGGFSFGIRVVKSLVYMIK